MIALLLNLAWYAVVLGFAAILTASLAVIAASIIDSLGEWLASLSPPKGPR